MYITLGLIFNKQIQALLTSFIKSLKMENKSLAFTKTLVLPIHSEDFNRAVNTFKLVNDVYLWHDSEKKIHQKVYGS